jgi:hypothetical protein
MSRVPPTSLYVEDGGEPKWRAGFAEEWAGTYTSASSHVGR